MTILQFFKKVISCLWQCRHTYGQSSQLDIEKSFHNIILRFKNNWLEFVTLVSLGNFLWFDQGVAIHVSREEQLLGDKTYLNLYPRIPLRHCPQLPPTVAQPSLLPSPCGHGQGRSHCYFPFIWIHVNTPNTLSYSHSKRWSPLPTGTMRSSARLLQSNWGRSYEGLIYKDYF